MSRFQNLEFEDSHRHERQVEEVHDAAYYLAQADRERRQRNYETALRYYSRSLEDNAQNVEGWIGQVRMLIGLEEYSEAELWSKKALERFRDQPDLLAARGQSCCRLGKFEEAMRWSDGAIQAKGESAYRWQVRGEVLLAQRQPKEEHSFSKAALLSPDWLVALEIADIYLHYDYASKALKWVQQVIERAPDYAGGWLLRARAQSRLRMHDAAKDSYRECLKLAPTHVEAHRELAELNNGESWWRRIWKGWWAE